MSKKIRTRSCSRKTTDFALAALVAAPALVASPASGAVRTWVANSGNWSVAANWSGGVVPTGGDDAGILGIKNLAAPVVTYDYTGPAVTLLFLRIDSTVGSIITAPDTLTQAANTLHSAIEQIGINARGQYNLSGGTNTVDGLLTLGANSGSSGSFNVSGTGFLGAGSIIVGDQGLGSMNLSGGSISASTLSLGSSGAGSFIHSGGTTTMQGINGGLFLGVNTGGSGTYQLSGSGVLTNSAGGLFVGNAGAGTFIQTGGTHSLGTGSVLSTSQIGAAATGSGTYLLSGTGVLNSRLFNVGNAGTGLFDQTGGTHNAGAMTLGALPGARGTYQLSGGVFRATLPGGGFGDIIVGGSGAGTFNQSGGTCTIGDRSSNEFNPRLVLGSGTGSSGVFNLSGGVLETVIGTRVGLNGNGTFNQTGGTHTSLQIEIGSNGAAPGNGTYLLSNSAILNVGTLGMQVGGGGGSGTFIQSGGAVNIGDAGNFGAASVGGLGIGGFEPGITGNYQLSDGTLLVFGSELVAGGGGGTFNQTGGANIVNGHINVGGLTTLPGTYLLSGGTIKQRPVTFRTSDGNLATSGSFTINAGGTLIGGAAGGSVDADLALRGGTINGVLRNDGTFTYQSGTFNAQLINRGTVNVGGNTLVGPTGSNEDFGIINGPGALAMPITNRGTINPNGSLTSQAVQNTTGLIAIGAGDTFTPAQVENTGRIALAGGKLLGSGTVSNNAGGSAGGGVIAGGGTIALNITQNGGTLRADDPSRPLIVTSPIVTTDSASQIVVAANCVLSLQTPLSNSAILKLQSPDSRLTGAAITNTGTIKGAGLIENHVSNNGIIRPESGALEFSDFGNVNNSNGQILIGANAVRFSQGMVVNSGTTSFAGGEFDNNGAELNNDGTIIGRGTIRAGALFNTGTCIFSGGTTDIFAPVTNQRRITITGNSATTFFNPVSTGGGSINITLGSTAVFLAPVTGIGNITGPGTKDFESSASAGAIMTTSGTTIVGPAGNLTASAIQDGTLRVFGHANELPDGTNAGTSRLNTLLIDGTPDNWTGQWDLSNNALVVDYAATDPSPLSTIANQIKTGFASGSWSGNGITSSTAAANASSAHRTALGYAENSSLSLSTFRGQSVDATSVLVRYTFAGDGNLDGKVDLTDFTFLAANFNGTGKLWLQGDYNYDAKVDLTDFTFLASNFNQSLPAARDVALGANVPEPTSGMVGLMAAMIGGAMRRQRRAVAAASH